MKFNFSPTGATVIRYGFHHQNIHYRNLVHIQLIIPFQGQMLQLVLYLFYSVPHLCFQLILMSVQIPNWKLSIHACKQISSSSLCVINLSSNVTSFLISYGLNLVSLFHLRCC